MLIVHGVLSLGKVSELRQILSNDHLSDSVPSIVICIGVFIFIISFFGCCGAMQANVCLLETYSICLLMLVLVQVILACFIFLFINDIQRDTAQTFSKMWKSRINSKNSRVMIDIIQDSLECCGSRSSFDYVAGTIPKSCCSRETDICVHEIAFKIGCRDHLRDSIGSSSKAISYACIGAAIFELCGAIMGFILSGYIRKVHAIRRCCLWWKKYLYWIYEYCAWF